jgi:thymidylate synthase ThyX
MGLHKQVANRIPEVFSMMKTVLTGTEFNNLYWLRLHEDAQPEFQELVKVMELAHKNSVPTVLKVGEWHLPYVHIDNQGEYPLYLVGQELVDLETAKQVSSSCCAQVSYRRLDDSIDKAKDIYQRLISAVRVHASPFEHQATPIPTDRD